jgi:hypothetical protein
VNIAETLWDLVGLSRKKPSPKRHRSPVRRPPRSPAMQARYDELVEQMKERWEVKVHRWRNSTSGCAWQLKSKDGTITRMIESPYPRGPMSCVVFLHEIGHHAIGFGRYRPRCLEEQMAWLWAMDAMREHGFNVTVAIDRRYANAMRYAIAKALRRGLKRIPESLIEFAPDHLRVQMPSR